MKRVYVLNKSRLRRIVIDVTAREPISTRFTASSTADDVLQGVDLGAVRAIVTGASSGIGIETARALTAAGAEVTLAVRNTEAGDAVADTIETSTGAIRPRVAQLGLADRNSVARFTETWDGPLHLLINNAGLVTSGMERTPEGWELQFATNHLGHFALATGLHDALALGASERHGARIVSLSSTAHMRSGIDFDDSTSSAAATTHRSPTPSPRPRTPSSQSKQPAGGPPTASSPMRSTPAVSQPDCNETSRPSRGSRSTLPKPPASLPTRPLNREPPRRSSRPSPRSSLTPEVTISTTRGRPTPCRTTPTSRSTHTV